MASTGVDVFEAGDEVGDVPRLGVSRTVRKATSVTGGSKQSGSTISNWTAEMFLPYTLLKLLQNVPPQPGTHWRANFPAHGRVIVTVLLPASLPVVRTTKTLNEATSVGALRPSVVENVVVPGEMLPMTVAVAAS